VLILSIDTSSADASVALLRACKSTPRACESTLSAGENVPRGEANTLQTIELAALPGGHASEQLLPTVASMLERHGLPRRSIELLAVASGPGSFTGLRVAVATVKGLAQAFASPLVAVSVLKALALAAKVEGHLLPVVDAQRKEVFFGEYLVTGESATGFSATMQREGLAASEDFARVVERAEEFPPDSVIVTHDAKLAEALTSAIHDASRKVLLVAHPNAVDYARIALARHLAGEHDDPSTLDANYLRRSDAEIFSAPRTTPKPGQSGD
jgi:tRNA threonylcarbamoyladenosine biosynthesis protein TsaB